MNTLRELLALHTRTTNREVLYGTAGFRDKYEDLNLMFCHIFGSLLLPNVRAFHLEHIMFRMGILAAIRSRDMKATIGVMITASHNPEEDNGLKLIDPKGEMLDSTWESIATKLANISDDDVEQSINDVIHSKHVDMTREASVYVGRDTRISSADFAKAVIDGVKAANGAFIDFGLLTTPQLHYIVLCRNTDSVYGDPSEVGYYHKLAKAFVKLNGESGAKQANGDYNPSVIVDGGNGVGAIKLKLMKQYLGNSLDIKIINDGDGVLNHLCGADFVKVQQKPPQSLSLESGQRYLSFDGDADRIIYYYKNSVDQQFHMLDGDKIAVLITSYIKDLLTKAQLSELELCIVQTAYANGNSTSYIEDTLKVAVCCVPTGVKHLHHRAQQSDIGIYFEANGHGTCVFSDKAVHTIRHTRNEAANKLSTLIDVINQTVGDAISDMLVVETILRSTGQSAENWDNLYTDLPNRQMKVNVKNRNVITTGDAERKCLTPDGLQLLIDQIVAKYGPKSRAFIRPSGTEDVVRVYAESTTQESADSLARNVANAVFDLAGGVGQRFE